MIILLDKTNKHQYPDLMQSMFRLRKRMFIDKLGWDLPHENGMEIDQFDNEHTVYFVETIDGKTCRGAWRGYPTTQPYMVETIFPDFFNGHEIVKSPHAYEFSRSVVDWEAFDMDQHKAKRVHIRLYCASVEWCIMHDVFEVISFTDPRVTRRTSYLYGKPAWKGKIMDCGAGKAQAVIYRPGIEQIRKFREELQIEAPALTQYANGIGINRRAG